MQKIYIKRLKEGKDVAFLSVGDLSKIIENEDEFKDVDGIELIFNYMKNMQKKMEGITKAVLSKYLDN